MPRQKSTGCFSTHPNSEAWFNCPRESTLYCQTKNSRPPDRSTQTATRVRNVFDNNSNPTAALIQRSTPWPELQLEAAAQTAIKNSRKEKARESAVRITDAART